MLFDFYFESFLAERMLSQIMATLTRVSRIVVYVCMTGTRKESG